MAKQALKKRVIDAIDARAKEIIKIGDDLWRIPEVGYMEYKTAAYVERQYERMSWYYDTKLGLTRAPE
jgi:metal-dependent amidase/aminoacylase/carboxypeptidase family protein